MIAEGLEVAEAEDAAGAVGVILFPAAAGVLHPQLEPVLLAGAHVELKGLGEVYCKAAEVSRHGGRGAHADAVAHQIAGR